jgi:hypothetical protein
LSSWGIAKASLHDKVNFRAHKKAAAKASRFRQWKYNYRLSRTTDTTTEDAAAVTTVTATDTMAVARLSCLLTSTLLQTRQLGPHITGTTGKLLQADKLR